MNAAGDMVRALKAEKAEKAEIQAAIDKLKELKIDLEAEIKKAKESGDKEAKDKVRRSKLILA